MENTLLSIVIPAYNSAEVIANTVNSVIKQIGRNDKIEILIVENGSTDNTTKASETLEKQNPIVRVLHSAKGVSNARNKGVEEAKGEWVAFLDADDEFLDGAVSALMRDASEGMTDIYFYGHMNGNEVRSVCDNNTEQYFDKSNMDSCEIMMLSNPTRYLQVWAKLIRRELIVQNQIRFDPSLRLAEDSDFMLKCLEKATSVRIRKENIYHYMLSDESAMRTFDGNKVNDYIHAMETTQQSLDLSTEELKKAYSKYTLLHFNVAMVRETFSEANPASFFIKKKAVKTVFKGSIFEKSAKMVPCRECFSVRMLSILCIKMHFYLGASVIYQVRAKQNSTREKK